MHDRYRASRRNPWNEIECGDHYARIMASYGVFLAACGFEYHGPKEHLGFAPTTSRRDFKAAFTSAEGWGTFSQKANPGKLQAQITLHSGKLSLKTVALEFAGPDTARVTLGENVLPATTTRQAAES